MVRASVAANRVPHGKRHTEEALPADAPVAHQAVHPVLVAVPHEFRMPLQLTAARDQRLAVLDGLDEPLPARDDLERPVALLEEFHRMGDWLGIANQIAGLAQ